MPATVLFVAFGVAITIGQLGTIAIGLALAVLQGVAGPPAIGRTVTSLTRKSQ